MGGLARAAYEAYGRFTGALNYEGQPGAGYQGQPMPGWDDLPDQARAAWDAAAQAVLAAQGPGSAEAQPGDEERISAAMAEAADYPGRTVTR